MVNAAGLVAIPGRPKPQQSTDEILSECRDYLKRIANVLDPPNPINVKSVFNIQASASNAPPNGITIQSPNPVQGGNIKTRTIEVTCASGAVDVLISPDTNLVGSTQQADFTVSAGGFIRKEWNGAVFVTLRNSSTTTAATGMANILSY